MNKEDTNHDDAKLRALLNSARVSPPLPPRFQENVWRRIEAAELSAKSTESVPWLDALVALILRPRFAAAAVAVLMLGGILLGAHNGAQTAQRDAKASYLASVAPLPLR